MKTSMNDIEKAKEILQEDKDEYVDTLEGA